MKVEVIEPHGFCAGVSAALRAADKALASAIPPSPVLSSVALAKEDARSPSPQVFCLHEIVHNELVVRDLESRGMKFVQRLDEVPTGATVLFSAHGVSPEVVADAASRGLKAIDATCPFVGRVHRQVRDYAAAGIPVLIIGHSSHVEVVGVAGEVRALGGVVAIVNGRADVESLDWPCDGEIGVVSQTTLSADETRDVSDAIRARFPNAKFSLASDVCNATRDRQRAVRDFVNRAKSEKGRVGVLVLGSAQSSNTRRLAEIAEAAGAVAWRAGTIEAVSEIGFSGIDALGITSGASTPEDFLDAVVTKLCR